MAADLPTPAATLLAKRPATRSYAPRRAPGFVPLLIVFALFVAFLYGPMLTIFILSFQGPDGGLTFPLQGVSLHWFRKLALRYNTFTFFK